MWPVHQRPKPRPYRIRKGGRQGIQLWWPCEVRQAMLEPLLQSPAGVADLWTWTFYCRHSPNENTFLRTYTTAVEKAREGFLFLFFFFFFFFSLFSIFLSQVLPTNQHVCGVAYYHIATALFFAISLPFGPTKQDNYG